MNIRDMTDIQIRESILRCRLRLTGKMPMGILTKDKVSGAEMKYLKEIKRRNNK